MTVLSFPCHEDVVKDGGEVGDCEVSTDVDAEVVVLGDDISGRLSGNNSL